MKKIIIFSVGALIAIYLCFDVIYNCNYFPQSIRAFDIEGNEMHREIHPPFGHSYGLIITCPRDSRIIGKGTVVLKNKEKMVIPFDLCECEKSINNNKEYNSFIINYKAKKGVIGIDSLFKGKNSVNVSLVFEIPPPKEVLSGFNLFSLENISTDLLFFEQEKWAI